MLWLAPGFPFTRLLEESAATIRSEAEALSVDAWDNWPDRPAYSTGWRVYGLFSRDPAAPLAETCRANALRCPLTTTLLARIPGLLRGGFSMLLPGAHIYPHADTGAGHLRCHLALWTNPEARLRIGGSVLSWEAGRCIVFDGEEEHEAANLGGEHRVVLLLDVLRAHADDEVGPGKDAGA